MDFFSNFTIEHFKIVMLMIVFLKLDDILRAIKSR